MPNGMNEDPNEEESLIQEEADRQRQLAEQMRQEEAALMSALPTQAIAPPTDIGPFPMQTEIAPPPQPEPLNLPVSAGRMYMGPALSPGAEEAFRSLPTVPGRGVSINLAPPPSGPPPTTLQRLQALDRPGSETISVRENVPIPVPEGQSPQFAAMQEWNRLSALGIPPEERAQRIGLDYFLRRPGMTISPAQQANLDLRGQQLAIQQQAEDRRAAAAESRESPAIRDRRNALLRQENSYIMGIAQGRIDRNDPAVIQDQLRIQRELDSLTAPKVTAPKPTRTTLAPNEEIRMTSDGRRVVFDKRTRKWVRNAD